VENGPDGMYDRVECQYNRQAEVIWKKEKDQNATVHQLSYDRLGRAAADRVSSLVEYSYPGRGSFSPACGRGSG